MLDSRLFNQESLSGSFADDDAYNLYDRPLFHGSSAAAAIYKARGNITEGNDESYGGGTEEGITRALDNDRFGLGRAQIGFEGASEQEVREGPVQFEKDTGDVFGLDKFLDEAKTGRKRGLDTEVCVSVPMINLTSQTNLLYVGGVRGNDSKWTRRRNESHSAHFTLVFSIFSFRMYPVPHEFVLPNQRLASRDHGRLIARRVFRNSRARLFLILEA
jgi:hypothetical protein